MLGAFLMSVLVLGSRSAALQLDQEATWLPAESPTRKVTSSHLLCQLLRESILRVVDLRRKEVPIVGSRFLLSLGERIATD